MMCLSGRGKRRERKGREKMNKKEPWLYCQTAQQKQWAEMMCLSGRGKRKRRKRKEKKEIKKSGGYIVKQHNKNNRQK